MKELKEHPILFSGPMVQAILAGIKTQTRRVINADQDNLEVAQLDDGPFVYEHDPKCEGYCEYGCDGRFIGLPYGDPNDLLWVRETWCVFPRNSPDGMGRNVYYKASQQSNDELRTIMNRNGVKWKPSIHMFRKDSRIMLSNLGTQAQRLQDISEEDAIAEGVYFFHSQSKGLEDTPYYRSLYSPRELFKLLWDSINSKRGYSWESNPWVWAITFKEHWRKLSTPLREVEYAYRKTD